MYERPKFPYLYFSQALEFRVLFPCNILKFIPLWTTFILLASETDTNLLIEVNLMPNLIV